MFGSRVVTAAVKNINRQPTSSPKLWKFYLDQLSQQVRPLFILRDKTIPHVHASGTDYHCMVQWNETHTMLIGGINSASKTYFYDWSSMEWINGPDLVFPRAGHACTVTRDEFGVKKVMVAGGGSWHAEFFDENSLGWEASDGVIPIGKASLGIRNT